MSWAQDSRRPLRALPGESEGADRRGATARLQAARALFDPGRLRAARQLARLRKTDLAQVIGVTPSAVGQYETGAATPSVEVLGRLALQLGVPVEFFCRAPQQAPVHDPAAAHFRSLRATTQLERSQALAFGELVWQVAEGLTRWVRLPVPDLPELAVPLEADPAMVERAAADTRAALGLGVEPIGHVVRLVESRGALVAVTPARLSARVDAFSHWMSDRPIIVLSAAKNDAARSRFDAAHELGHLVMHHDADPGSQLRERQAHLFASCFLAPPERLAEQLPRRLDWSRLAQLKTQWGMSLKSLAFAAHRLGVWGDSTYRTAMRQYTSRWNREEPVDIGAAERPALFGKAVDLLHEHGVALQELCDATGIPIEMLDEVLDAACDTPRFELSL